MANFDEIMKVLAVDGVAYTIDDVERVLYSVREMKGDADGEREFVVSRRTREHYETSCSVRGDYFGGLLGRLVAKVEWDNFFWHPNMDIKSYIGEQFRLGKKVYVIDDYERCAVCYDPKREDVVYVKKRGRWARACDLTDRDIFEATMNGDVATASEYRNY